MDDTEEYLIFSGHCLTKASHKTTLEITKAMTLTNRGTCIIGVNASKSCKDLNPEFKKKLSSEQTKVIITINVNNEKITINASGHPSLTLTDPEDIVIRKSSFICDRTLAIHADKAASDIPSHIVDLLKDTYSQCSMKIKLETMISGNFS